MASGSGLRSSAAGDRFACIRVHPVQLFAILRAVSALGLIPWLQRVSQGALYGRAGPTRYAGPRDGARCGRGASDLPDAGYEAQCQHRLAATRA